MSVVGHGPGDGMYCGARGETRLTVPSVDLPDTRLLTKMVGRLALTAAKEVKLGDRRKCRPVREVARTVALDVKLCDRHKCRLPGKGHTTAGENALEFASMAALSLSSVVKWR